MKFGKVRGYRGLEFLKSCHKRSRKNWSGGSYRFAHF